MRRTLLLAVLLPFLLAMLPDAAWAQATGILDVQVDAPASWVIIDGAPAGQTPFLEIIPAGKHEIVVRRDGFADFVQAIHLKPDTSVEIRAQLLRIEPGLEVTVDVDAVVSLDGAEIGTGRKVLMEPAPRGAHELTVSAEGYGTWKAQVNLTAGVLTPVQVALRGSLGGIKLASDPAGARVFLDGEDQGKTPLTIEPLSPGTHGLRVEGKGASTVLQQVVVEPGKVVAVELTLVDEGGSLEIKPSVSDARVLVNGVSIGAGRQLIEALKPGTYSIRVTAPEHTDFIRSVLVEEDKKAVVVAKLEAFAFDGGRTRLAGGPPGGEPVMKKPGFWAAVGGGVGAAIAVGVIAGAVANRDPGVEPVDDSLRIPATDLQLVLP